MAQLNSISLSKNIIRALDASKVDMPPLEAFPKSHIVTFKYYVGVILFLEEKYAQVRRICTLPIATFIPKLSHINKNITKTPTGTRTPHFRLPNVSQIRNSK